MKQAMLVKLPLTSRLTTPVQPCILPARWRGRDEAHPHHDTTLNVPVPADGELCRGSQLTPMCQNIAKIDLHWGSRPVDKADDRRHAFSAHAWGWDVGSLTDWLVTGTELKRWNLKRFAMQKESVSDCPFYMDRCRRSRG